MINSNIKQAIRHLKKDRINTLINITGLTLSLSIVAVVAVFLINELGYNRSVKKKDRIYRVLNYDEITQKETANSPFILGETSKAQIPGIEAFTHVTSRFSVDLKINNEFINQPNAICLDGAFFDMFDVKILQGKLTADFDNSNNHVFISKSLANKCFGNKEVVGNELIVKIKKEEKTMQIAGVFADIPQNSIVKAEMVFNMKFAFERFMADAIKIGGEVDLKTLFYSWEGGQLSSNYILLKKNADITEVERQIAKLGKENSTNQNKMDFSLQPLNHVYFGSKTITDNTYVEKGNLNMIFILAIIGLLILLIACVNYLNLSLAQAFTRSKNLSVNRAFGASRSGIIWQMITESVLVAFVALPLALLIAYYALPHLSEFLGHNYPLLITINVVVALLAVVAITLIAGIFSGWFVALKITSFNVARAIKSKNIFVGDKFLLRKLSITFQFMVFIVLLVIVLGVNKQVNYVMNADMGFVKEGLIKINKGDKNYEVFKQEILKNPSVISVSAALWLPPSNNMMNMSYNFSDKTVLFRGNMVDYDFVKTMGLKLLEGECFEKGKHSNGILLSKSAAELIRKDDEELIGKDINYGKIVGIVSDFNMSSLHDKTAPMLLMLQPVGCSDIAVRINTENIKKTLAFLEQAYNKLEGTTPFNYQFTDDILKEMYKSDTRFSQLIALLAFFAVFIASLGLFGLSVLISKRRTKEIGIRKVNGATITEVLTMLNQDFIKWVIIAFVIATPIAYYAMSRWLENFAYKTALSWWIFALAGLSALVIALLTVSWQSWHAASRNPVEALRYE